jgi:hypothetical protein
VIEGSRNPIGGHPRADRDGEAQGLSTPLSGGTTMPSVRIRAGCGGRKPRHCLMLLENPLHPVDRLVGEIEPAGEFAKLEFFPLHPGQGRGGGERGRGDCGVRCRGDGDGTRPARAATGQRPPRRGGGFAQRGEMLEAVEPPLAAVGHLAGDAEHDKAFEQACGVLGRHAEGLAERGGGNERGRRQDVDRRGSARIAAPAGDGAPCGKPVALEGGEERQPVFSLLGEGVEEMPEPCLARPRDVSPQRPGAGQQRAGEGGHPARHPVSRQRRAQRWPFAAPIEPGVDAECGAEQRRMPAGDRIEACRRVGDRRLLRLVRPAKPPVEGEGVMGSGEDHAAVDQRRAAVEAEADPLDQGREVPRVDRPAVDQSLAADGVEAGAPGPGRGERVAGERRIEAGDGADRMLESGGERQWQAFRAGLPVVVNQDDP